MLVFLDQKKTLLQHFRFLCNIFHVDCRNSEIFRSCPTTSIFLTPFILYISFKFIWNCFHITSKNALKVASSNSVISSKPYLLYRSFHTTSSPYNLTYWQLMFRYSNFIQNFFNCQAKGSFMPGLFSLARTSLSSPGHQLLYSCAEV